MARTATPKTLEQLIESKVTEKQLAAAQQPVGRPKTKMGLWAKQAGFSARTLLKLLTEHNTQPRDGTVALLALKLGMDVDEVREAIEASRKARG